MLIVGALSLLYAFAYLSGGMAALGQARDNAPAGSADRFVSIFDAAEGKYDYKLFEQIQPFNNVLMYCGIAMILLAVLLYVTACNSRRNYYVTNYIATGACACGNIVMSIVLMAINASWRSKFLKVDFDSWKVWYDEMIAYGGDVKYSSSTLWFDLGFVVYSLVIVASIVLILNLVWKILLMQGEKKLLNAPNKSVEGGAAV